MLELIAVLGTLFILSSGLAAQLLRGFGFEMAFALIFCSLFVGGLFFGESAGFFLGNQVEEILSNVEVGK